MAVVLMTDNHSYSIQQQLITTGLVLTVIALTAVILLIAGKVQDYIGTYGITVISKVMGLILASYAVQSILSGIGAYYNLN